MENSHEFKTAHRTSSLIGAVVIASLVIYVLIVIIIVTRFQFFAGFAEIRDIRTLRYVFYGVSILIVLLIRSSRKIFLKPSPGDTPVHLIRKLSQAAVITLFLCEVPAILGLVLFFLSGLTLDFFFLAFVSMFLVFMYFPRKNTWEAWLREKTGPAAMRGGEK